MTRRNTENDGRLAVVMPFELRQQWKVYCAKRGIDMSAMLRDYIRELVSKEED